MNPDDHFWEYDTANMAMTYTALCCLLILGDDLSRVEKKSIISSFKYLQQPDGSFAQVYKGGETDMRFIYCACAISALLNDWSGFDLDRAADYIVRSQSYDGGIALFPGAEGHGGSTYCGVASLYLMKKLHLLRNPRGLFRWCIKNQGEGFRGRPNKPQDSCYSFWLGASLVLLGGYEWTDRDRNRAFNFVAQGKHGGFAKIPGAHADILHSYMGLAGLALMGKDHLRPPEVSLGICPDRLQKLSHLQLPKSTTPLSFLNSSLSSSSSSSTK